MAEAHKIRHQCTTSIFKALPIPCKFFNLLCRGQTYKATSICILVSQDPSALPALLRTWIASASWDSRRTNPHHLAQKGVGLTAGHRGAGLDNCTGGRKCLVKTPYSPSYCFVLPGLWIFTWTDFGLHWETLPRITIYGNIATRDFVHKTGFLTNFSWFLRWPALVGKKKWSG